jgi:hypothetical protein
LFIGSADDVVPAEEALDTRAIPMKVLSLPHACLVRLWCRVDSAGDALLHGVGEFVGQKVLARGLRSIGHPVTKEDVAAVGECQRSQPLVDGAGYRSVMNTHCREVGPERRFHASKDPSLQGTSSTTGRSDGLLHVGVDFTAVGADPLVAEPPQATSGRLVISISPGQPPSRHTSGLQRVHDPGGDGVGLGLEGVVNPTDYQLGLNIQKSQHGPVACTALQLEQPLVALGRLGRALPRRAGR